VYNLLKVAAFEMHTCKKWQSDLFVCAVLHSHSCPYFACPHLACASPAQVKQRESGEQYNFWIDKKLT
jgi:hypothetical protein